MIDKAKFEKKANGLYLYGCLIFRTDILTPGVCGSSSSDSSSVVESDSSFFRSNSIFPGSFDGTSSLIKVFTSLNLGYKQPSLLLGSKAYNPLNHPYTQ